ncbi:Retrovirus-related Pol polyprotein from type-2 retrotransposable element R2DM [Sesamum angolense]|uniref:Retrovirus-related Pol polyprotein from type-2 retrotransposable element R2DM n=1 Tax=Sesamum angolense TaxID=2727404 RepID=A0AAE1VZD3_9LAMI|nr:Retrovirus-related Pol polyprotein from type-2 retrotransposable element R2DM [Sesamum angolense]
MAMDLRYLRPWARNIITDEEASLLIRPITKDDVKIAVFDIEEDRAPGPDGYSSGFFKAAWSVVGEEITAAVMDFFTTGRLLKQVNATLITLIPKCFGFGVFWASSLARHRLRFCRSISDNVLLAQELFSGYNQSRLPPRCALKVDLRKAYDTVEWDFLLATIQLFGFPPTFSRWIEECVTTPHFSLYLNGEDGGFAYHWQCKELGLFQLSFADDLILLCKVEVRSVDLFRYCQPLLRKIDARIRGWDGVGLSFAGRVQLIKSVLLAFDVYWAMAFLLPKGVIKEIVKRIRTFLWKGTSSSGYPKVAWESVCKPIEEGGQGIRDILALNRALMSRHLWSVIKHEKESIWVDWIAHYRLRVASIWTVNAKRGAWSWRKMLELRDIAHLEFVQNLPPIHTGSDVITWDSNGGDFTNAAAYHLFRPPGPKVGYPLWINHGYNILDTASYVLMGGWRRTTTFSLLAGSPDTALLLSEDTSDSNALMWIGNVASCGPRPDGEVTMWLLYLKASKLEQVMLRQWAKLQWLKVFTPWARHILTEDEARAIIRPVTSDEVKTTFFDIEEDKAPGPDGFSSGFFKAAWPVVGEEVSNAIIDFFKTGRLLKQLNATLLTLIPKVRNPHSVAEFRPISCCNVTYKVITKILVSRIREIPDLLISPSQNAFVPGRLISDNVLLAQELFSGYNQCRLPPRCALKVDLRKAYDTVEWDFLIATLRMFGFPAVFIKWIEECVTSAHYSVVVNGGVHGFFVGARGLRQGDPMSPYLFVLVMEVLHMILQQLIKQDGEFRRIKGWEGVQLYFAGRVQLIKSVLISFEVYWAMAFILPKGIIKEMIKRLCTFLWKGTSFSGYPKVAWEAVCRPIEEGGLGIKDILALNRALMSKHLWAVIKQDRNSIWVVWIIQVRLRNCSIWKVKENKGAWGWRKMLSLRHSLMTHIHYRVGNGDSVSLWHDPWHPLGPLISRFPRDLR